MASFKKCAYCGVVFQVNSSLELNCPTCVKKFNDLNKIVIEKDNKCSLIVDKNVANHKSICDELNSLYAKKNKDYGNSFTKTYEEFGLVMSAIRLNDKLERFKRLINNKNEVKDESIRDTLVDLANYAIMTVMEMDKNE